MTEAQIRFDEIEEALRFKFSNKRAYEYVTAWRADRDEVRKLRGLLNNFNQCGDVSRLLNQKALD
jgi:hypothetical protein